MGLFALFLLAGCGRAPAPPAGGTPAAAASRSNVNRIVDNYWDAYLELNPMRATETGDHRFDDRIGNVLAIEHLADSLALEHRALADLSAVPVGSLDVEARLTYDLFKHDRELAIEGFTYPFELMPVNPFDSLPQRFALWGSGGGAQPFASARDYERWLSRIDDFRRWTVQAIANMRDGLRRGYTLPRNVVERTLPQLKLLGEDTPSNVFYLPLHAMPSAIPEPARAELARRFADAVKATLLPSYRELHAFLQTEYLPRARAGISLAELPLGDAWYAYLVRRSTTFATTPAEVHTQGLAQVDVLHARIESLLAEAAFAGNLPGFLASLRDSGHAAFAGGEDLLAAYRDLQAHANDAARALFVLPDDPAYEVRAVPHGCEAALPAVFYQAAAPNGAQPAIFYVDTADPAATPPYALQAQSLNVGVPGHHLQQTIQRTREASPRFRRFAVYPGFTEGWGAYAATLGPELGLATDPAARLGTLMAEMHDAVGLVIDTGLHAKGWTRKQALEYAQAHLPVDADQASVMVDRIAALPGAALAAGVGSLKIQSMRLRAQQQQGAGFDLRAFHTAVLAAGAMPLDMLESRLTSWMQTPP